MTVKLAGAPPSMLVACGSMDGTPACRESSGKMSQSSSPIPRIRCGFVTFLLRQHLLHFLHARKNFNTQLVAGLSHPTVNRAIFPCHGGVLTVGLAGQDFAVGQCVGVGPPDLALKHAREAWLLCQYVLLFIVHVEDVQLCGARTLLPHEAAGPTGEHASQHGSAKWIEEKCDARAWRQRELHRVTTDHP